MNTAPTAVAAPPPYPNSSSSSFTFLHPNPNFHPSNPQSPPPPPHDLPGALSILKHLTRLSETTVGSVSALLRPTAFSDGLCACSFNSRHRVPPESLFRHSLQCSSSSSSSSLTFDLVDLVQSLHYPNTLQSSDELAKQNRFVKTPQAELCFSLDFSDSGSNFFYQDCPGVFSLSDADRGKQTFTLPTILSAECADYYIGNGDSSSETKGFSRVRMGFLPSEFWLVRSEIEAWNDYATSYSYNVLRVILCLSTIKDHDFLRWVIVNSPRYGVVIDVPMREHIVLLFRLCLKAIVKEAEICVFSRELSVLYGKVKGKSFAIDMLKQCLVSAVLNASLFPIVKKATDFTGGLKEVVDHKLEEPLGTSVSNEGNSIEGETLIGRWIFVSQVAAAVAALHERFSLEVKMKALQDAQSLSSHNRMAEHAYISNRAEEERQKRCNYRPVLDHDGLLWQRSRNQGASKMKTREELLAEERDYKRRRMSYRGKKLKRTTTQVIRDIIEEYMEEFKQGGRSQEVSTDEDLKKTASNSNEVSREMLHGLSKLSHPRDNIRSTEVKDQSPEDCKRRRRDSHLTYENLESSVSRGRQNYSRSPDEQGRKGRSHEYNSHHGHRDDVQSTRRREQIHDVQSSRRREQIDQNSEVKERERSNRSRNRKIDSAVHGAFEDRYDPSESHDLYEDDVFSRSNY